MGVSTVLDPSVLNKACFNPTYRMHTKDFLNSIEKNGLLIVDSENKLQNAIFEQIKSLPTKDRQQLQIRFEELFKNKKKRVVECYILSNYASSENLLDLAFQLKEISQAEVLIVGGKSTETLTNDQKRAEGIVLLSEYLNSDFESSRQRRYEKLKSTETYSESEAEDTITHSLQFSDWLASVVNCDLFISRERLIVLLTEEAPHEALEDEFREFFNGYYVLALEMEEHEESILEYINRNHTFAHLKHRVSAVEAQRKSSPLGREARRMGLSLHDDPVPEIKVAELPSNEFQSLMHTLGNWRLFVARERLVKLMETKESTEIADRLRAEFYEFFVCYLELELFLENYDYDPDDGLELRPEFIEALEREEEYIQSGGKMYTLEEVAEELGIELKNV